jgi:2-polyprenyl-3-methyl-5-hydroxy-6-metoxy-1,4-benzoquinol methylase
MASDSDHLAQWHQDEKNWWDAYGGYMTYQWQMTPAMSSAVRSELETDYKQFLLQPGECLLDLGCGRGWLSVFFAENGMEVIGVDISQEQIYAANELRESRGVENATFICTDFLAWDVADCHQKFSSVFVSAFLHHLPESELHQTLVKIASVVKPGGRVYLYEPLEAQGGRKLVVKVVDRIYNAILGALLGWMPRRFGWWCERHTLELARGYTMNSPHERPVPIGFLRECCKTDFEIVEARGWQLNCLGFGMQVMGLKDHIRSRYEPLAGVFYKVDQLLLRRFGWEAFSTPGRFILCSLKLIRQ